MTSRLATVLVAGLLPVALTACGASRSPHTYEERPTVDAAQASVGDLQLRNVSVSAPSGGADELGVGDEATLTLSIVNMGEAGDRLVAVSTPAATSVELVDAEGATVDRIEVPPLGVADDFEVRLVGLTQAYRPGQHMDVTFTFTRGGRQTLVVPVEVYTEPVPRPTYDVFHIEEGGGGHGEGEGEHSDQEGSEPVTEAEGAEGLSEG